MKAKIWMEFIALLGMAFLLNGCFGSGSHNPQDDDKNSTNTKPEAYAQTINTYTNTSKEIILSGDDKDGDTLTYAVTITPKHGILSGTAPTLIYTPANGYYGTDSFQVQDQ